MTLPNFTEQTQFVTKGHLTWENENVLGSINKSRTDRIQDKTENKATIVTMRD
jgi:hypothetical protein